MTHFYEHIPETIGRLTHRQAVEAYAAGAAVPGEAIAGLTPTQLTSYPVPGTWSIQQIVLHLMDTDLIVSYRMKRIIAEENPKLVLYDENAFAVRLFYHHISAADACEIFRLNRHVTATILRNLSDSDFEHPASHPEVGSITIGRFVRLYVHHLEHHVKFIRQKRKLVEAQ